MLVSISCKSSNGTTHTSRDKKDYKTFAKGSVRMGDYSNNSGAAGMGSDLDVACKQAPQGCGCVITSLDHLQASRNAQNVRQLQTR